MFVLWSHCFSELILTFAVFLFSDWYGYETNEPKQNFQLSAYKATNVASTTYICYLCKKYLPISRKHNACKLYLIFY